VLTDGDAFAAPCYYPEQLGNFRGKKMNKTVDVVIPTFRPDERVLKLLKSLLEQSYPVDHILIVNTQKEHWNGKIDGMSEKIIVEHIEKQEFDHGATRHRALLMSRADVVVFMTQDALPADRELTEKLMKAMENREVGAAYARQLPAQDCGFIERYTRNFNYPSQSRVKGREDIKELGIKTYFCSNVCAAYDRKIYLEMGGFEKHTIFNEDMIMAARMIKAGYKVAYAADAQVIHSHNYSGIRQLHRNFDLAVSQADHPEIFQTVSSEGEGIRLVKKTAAYLAVRRPWLLPKLIWQSGCKYLGFWLGKRYRRLPRALVLKLTMNKEYWNQKLS
jgi:rhamnosyltransferase